MKSLYDTIRPLKRKALIIYCTNTQSGNLDGLQKDNENLRNYLNSCTGGCWRDGEIISLENPTAQCVSDCILNEFNDVDYAFVVFSGHGTYGTEGQILEVDKGCINVEDLTDIAPKQTLVINACRKHLNTAIDESKIFSFNNENISRPLEFLHRKMFDDAIRNMPKGTNVIYSTSDDEFAYCGFDGSVFINKMIDVCNTFGEGQKDSKGTLNTEEVVDMVGSIEVQIQDGTDTQVPEIKLLNDSEAFPLAVREISKIKRIKYNDETRTFSQE